MAKQLQILDPTFELPTGYDDLVKVYRKAAKAADQRLVRLEELTQDKDYRGSLRYAYAKAQRAIEEWSGEGATRFNRDMPKTVTGIKEKIQDIKSFLASSTSTKSAIKNVHMQRAEKLNKRYGTDYSWKEWDTFLNSEFMKKLEEEFGYTKNGTKEDVMAAVVKNKEEIVEALKDANDREIYVADTGDEMQDAIIDDIISKYSDDVLEALGVSPDKVRKNQKNQKSRKRMKK